VRKSKGFTKPQGEMKVNVGVIRAVTARRSTAPSRGLHCVCGGG